MKKTKKQLQLISLLDKRAEELNDLLKQLAKSGIKVRGSVVTIMVDKIKEGKHLSLYVDE